MMLPTYVRAYKDAIKGILHLDTETNGDPDAQQALAAACEVYARAVRESTVPDLDLAETYAGVLEYHLEEALNRVQELEPDPEDPEPTVSKIETVHPTADDIAVDVEKLEREPPAEAEPEPVPARPRKRIDLILEYVRANPGATKIEIADAVECSLTNVYYPVTKLVNQGALRSETDPGDGRIRYYAAGVTE